MLGGFLGTLLATLILYWVAPLLLGHPVNVGAVLGRGLGVRPAIGVLAWFATGTLLLPFVYAGLERRMSKTRVLWKGIAWGVLLWLATEVVLLPLGGEAVFHGGSGGIGAVLLVLVAAILYGWVVAALVGRRYETREREMVEMREHMGTTPWTETP
jgi:hypothetical protein